MPSTGLTHAFGQKMNFFLQLFSVKIRPEIMLNSLQDRKETFFGPKKCNLSKKDLPLRKFCKNEGYDFESICEILEKLGKFI